MTEFKSWEDLTPLEQAQSEYSDYFKSVHGFRPYSMVEGWTLEDYDSAFKVLEQDAIAENAWREQREKDAIEDFEDSLEKIQEICSCDRSTAWRYMKQAEGDDWYDSGYFEHGLGLPYGYLKYCGFESDGMFIYNPEQEAA